MNIKVAHILDQM